jgi:hypothetical protein
VSKPDDGIVQEPGYDEDEDEFAALDTDDWSPAMKEILNDE